MIVHPKEELLNRIADHPYGESLRGSVHEVYAVADHAKTCLDAIKSNKNLSEQGQREAICAAFKDDILPRFASAAKSYANAKAQIVGEKLNLGKPTLKDDNRSISERNEVRAALRNAPEAKRMQMAFEMVQCREAAEAMLSGYSPAVLTGLQPHQFATIKQMYLETHFGEEAARLKRYEDNIAPYKGALDLAYQALRNASGIPEFEFKKMMPAEFGNIAKLEAA